MGRKSCMPASLTEPDRCRSSCRHGRYSPALFVASRLARANRPTRKNVRRRRQTAHPGAERGCHDAITDRSHLGAARSAIVSCECNRRFHVAKLSRTLHLGVLNPFGRTRNALPRPSFPRGQTRAIIKTSLRAPVGRSGDLTTLWHSAVIRFTKSG